MVEAESPTRRGPSVGDLVAGLSVALVAIPQSLAYAELAGVPPQIGLFASSVPPIAAAFFVSSRYLQTGPVALTALLSFGALSTLEEPTTADYVALAALLALLVGSMRVILGLVRLGKLAYLLTNPVLIGFTSGAAILIISSQLPKVFGVDPGDGGVLAEAASALTSPSEWQVGAILFAVVALVCMFGGRRINPLFPGVLLAVVVGELVSGLVGYDGAVVGELNGEFVRLDLEIPWSATASLLLPALAIALVGFAEPASIARTFAEREGEPWDANREMVSQGAANIASGLVGAFPVGGSFSRSSLNKLAGATSRWAGLLTGLIVLISLPLTPVLEWLPQAVLGAIVIGAVIQLVRPAPFVAFFRSSWVDFGLAISTLGLTLVTAPRVERGVIAGVVLALIVRLARVLTGRPTEPLVPAPPS